MHTYYANGETEYCFKETVLLSSTSRVCALKENILLKIPKRRRVTNEENVRFRILFLYGVMEHTKQKDRSNIAVCPLYKHIIYQLIFVTVCVYDNKRVSRVKCFGKRKSSKSIKNLDCYNMYVSRIIFIVMDIE